VITVKILGAGSIGNHLSHACRSRGWAVTLCDVDPEALRRTREEIHPERYGSWDDEIRLVDPAAVAGERFDVVIIGTPPDLHLPIAMAELAGRAPHLLCVEKPLAPPDLAGCLELQQTADAVGTRITVGYNHTLTRHTVLAEEWLAKHAIGEITTIASLTREHWGGIFGAHPWLTGPKDSYLGFTARGGGALGEHSHAINIWQHFAHVVGAGRIRRVSAMLDVVEEGGARYDRLAQLNVASEGGLVGTIVQDVVTRPARKWLRVQGADGALEWEVSADPGHDALRTWLNGAEPHEVRVPKTRPDDFLPEVDHLASLLESDTADSPISLERGLDTMLVIAAALRSHEQGRVIEIDYERGPVPEALRAVDA